MTNIVLACSVLITTNFLTSVDSDGHKTQTVDYIEKRTTTVFKEQGETHKLLTVVYSGNIFRTNCFYDGLELDVPINLYYQH